MSKKESRQTRAQELRVQTGGDGSRTISGSILYNKRSVDLGGWTEIIAPGCFKDTLKHSDVLMLRDHQSSLLLGREKAGTLAIRDTPTALTFTCKLSSSPTAQDVAEAIDRKDLDGVSFGFVVAPNGDKWSSDSGQVTRTLQKVGLQEISVVSFPAYPSATVAIRSFPPEIRSLIERRQTSQDEDECTCPCSKCTDGDCSECSSHPCDYSGCTCPQHDEEERSATTVRRLSQNEVNALHMKLSLKCRRAIL